MPNEPASRFHPNSYRDYWPLPTGITGHEPGDKTPLAMGFLMFIDTPSIPQFGHTWNAMKLFTHFDRPLTGEQRWADYATAEIGDSNVSTHTLRQTGITAAAIKEDGDSQQMTYLERDLLLSAALIHDFGEMATTDVTYDVKQASKTAQDIDETLATFEMIDTALKSTAKTPLQERLDVFSAKIPAEEKLEHIPQDIMGARLKELYVRITTSLPEEEVAKLLPEQSAFDEPVDWNKLRSMFSLYERYGYLITAFQQWPYPMSSDPSLSQDEEHILTHWNRPELLAALENGMDVPDEIRRAILAKNVLLNQWSKILEADAQGIESAQVFFNNAITVKVLPQAKRIMGLDIDLGFIEEPTS